MGVVNQQWGVPIQQDLYGGESQAWNPTLDTLGMFGGQFDQHKSLPLQRQKGQFQYATPITTQATVLTNLIEQPILQQRVIRQPVISPKLIEQPILRTNTVVQPVIHPVVHQTFVQPRLTEKTTIAPSLIEQPVIQPRIVTQTIVQPQYQEQQLTNKPITNPTETIESAPKFGLIAPESSKQSYAASLGLGYTGFVGLDNQQVVMPQQFAYNYNQQQF
jgi:hypothetical protein